MDQISFLENKMAPLSLDGFEIFCSESHHFSVEAKEGELDSLDESVEHGVAVRLFKKGRCGFACSSDGTSPFLEKMLGLAYQSLSVIEEGGAFMLPLGDQKRQAEISPLSNIPIAEKYQKAIDLEKFS